MSSTDSQVPCGLLGLVPRMGSRLPTLPCALDLTQVPYGLRIQGSEPSGWEGVTKGLRGLQKPWQVRACHSRAGLGQSEEFGFSSSSLGKGVWGAPSS